MQLYHVYRLPNTGNPDFVVVGNEVRTDNCISILSSEYISQEARFNITAIDPGYAGPVNPNSTVEVLVAIEDINDNPPQFKNSEKNVFFEEDDFKDLPVRKFF